MGSQYSSRLRQRCFGSVAGVPSVCGDRREIRYSVLGSARVGVSHASLAFRATCVWGVTMSGCLTCHLPEV